MTDNLLWQAITTGMLGRRQKHWPNGWTGIDCPMCVLRGESPDKRRRCGIRNDGTIVVHCFNCGFCALYRPGNWISQSMRGFLAAIGTTKRDIGRVIIWAETVRREMGDTAPQEHVWLAPDYESAELPQGAKPLQAWLQDGCSDPWLVRVATYVLSRGDALFDAAYWSPDLQRYAIIPCSYMGRVVGWIARSAERNPKLRYLKEVPVNFLFNMDRLTQPKWQYVFIVEGAIDALAIDGIGLLGASLNQQQMAWIDQCGKQPVVIPDRDKAGARLAEIAAQRHWMVATPNFGRHQWWDEDIKDVAAAVQRHGKPYTVNSILNSLEMHPGIIRKRMAYHAISA